LFLLHLAKLVNDGGGTCTHRSDPAGALSILNAPNDYVVYPLLSDPMGGMPAVPGVSWQIVPTVLGEMLQDKDPKKSERVMEALLQMDKLDIETLRQAYDDNPPTASKERDLVNRSQN
jgi:hypothetical protein